MKISESEMAGFIVEWLKDQKWEVYQEVLCGGNRCDIVAVQGPIIWAIETKKNMSLALIEQALNWIPYAHYVSVGVPWSRRSVAEKLLSDNGIGILRTEYKWESEITEQTRPKLHRKIAPALKKSLHEEQKTYALAGNNKSAFYSPFKRTKEALVSLVQAKPGIKFSEAIGQIDFHYTTRGAALSSLRTWINSGVIGEIKIKDGRLFMAGDQEGSEMTEYGREG
jgi:hypothetical protein